MFSFPILKNGKSRLFLLRVSHSKVLNAERIIEFHCESGVDQTLKIFLIQFLHSYSQVKHVILTLPFNVMFVIWTAFPDTWQSIDGAVRVISTG